MLHVELLIQARTEHLSGLWHAAMGLHGWRNLQQSGGQEYVSLQILHNNSVENLIQIKNLLVAQPD